MNRILELLKSPLLWLILGALMALILVTAVVLFVKKIKEIQRSSRLMGARLRDIGELAVEEARCTVIHSVKEPRHFFMKELPWMRERCIFAIDAVVKIGINFDEIRARVDARHKKIVLEVPEMRILSSMLDYESMEIFDEKTGVFARPKLEWHRDSMQHLISVAEKKIEGFGAFERAKSSTKTRLEAFVGKLFNLTEYTLEFVFSDGECVASAPVSLDVIEHEDERVGA